MYAYSLDEERYTGEFETPEAAAAEAFADNDNQSIWVGEIKTRTAHDFVNGYGILESAAESSWDECGEWSEDWLSDVMKDKAKIAELEKLVGDWIQAQEPPNFWSVFNVKVIKPEEE